MTTETGKTQAGFRFPCLASELVFNFTGSEEPLGEEVLNLQGRRHGGPRIPSFLVWRLQPWNQRRKCGRPGGSVG